MGTAGLNSLVLLILQDQPSFTLLVDGPGLPGPSYLARVWENTPKKEG